MLQWGVSPDLFTVATEARCRITDDDINRADLSDKQIEDLIDIMISRGYVLGRDTEGRNEWWPPGVEGDM